MKSIQARLAELSLYTITDTPESYRRRIEQQLGMWGEVVKRAKLKPQ